MSSISLQREPPQVAIVSMETTSRLQLMGKPGDLWFGDMFSLHFLAHIPPSRTSQCSNVRMVCCASWGHQTGFHLQKVLSQRISSNMQALVVCLPCPANRPFDSTFDLLVSPYWAIFSQGCKRLTFKWSLRGKWVVFPHDHSRTPKSCFL